MSSSATGVGMPICFLGAILLILTQKSSQKFGDVLGIMWRSLSIVICSVQFIFLLFKLPICIEIFLQLSAIEHLIAQQAGFLQWGNVLAHTVVELRIVAAGKEGIYLVGKLM